MLIWEIRGLEGQAHRRGWIVAWDHGEAYDIARAEHAELIGEPVEWLPGHGGQVVWKADQVAANRKPIGYGPGKHKFH